MKTKAASLRNVKAGTSLCDALDAAAGDKEMLTIAALHAGMLLCDIGELPAEQMEDELSKLSLENFQSQRVTRALNPPVIIALMCAVIQDTEEELREQHTPATAAGKIEAALRKLSARYQVDL